MNKDELFAGDGSMMDMDAGAPTGSKTHTDPTASSPRADDEQPHLEQYKDLKGLYGDNTDAPKSTADTHDLTTRSATSEGFDVFAPAEEPADVHHSSDGGAHPLGSTSSKSQVDVASPYSGSPVDFSPFNTAGSAAPVQPTRVDLKANNASRVQKQQEAIKARTKQFDEDTAKADAATKKAAKEYLTNLETKRQYHITTVRADHIKEQQAYEQKMSQFKSKGAVWDSVNLLVNLSKPNSHSKQTEGMRNTILSLESSKAAAAGVL